MSTAGDGTRSARASKKKHPFVIRRSPIAGLGAFATRRIRKGQRVIEYVGEIITEKEADKRYPDDDAKGNHHTFLFELEGGKVIDASFHGNEARFINHCCQPNCEAIDEEGHIFIFAAKNIQAGHELHYDYCYARTGKDSVKEEQKYPCKCGAPRCRGTILERKKKRRKPKKGASAKSKRRR